MNNFQRFLLGVIVLETSIQVDSYLFYEDTWAEFGAIAGLNVSLSTICLGILYVMWPVEYAVGSATSRQRFHLNYALTAYLGIVALSCLAAQEKQLALNSLALLIQAYLVYVYVANRITTQGDVVYLVGLLVATLAIQGAVMAGVRMVGHEVAIGPIVGTMTDDARVGGTVGSPNTGASYLELLIAPAVAVLATSLPRSYKLLAFAAVALGAIGLLLTLTRGAWLAVALSLALLCFVAWRDRWISAWVPATCAISLLLVGLMFQESFAARLFGDDEGSALSRIPLMHMAWQIICDYPALGVGTNNCAVAAAQYAMLPEFREEWFYMIHNKYLLEWAEIGAVGLAAFLWFLFSTLRSGWMTWRRQDAVLSPLALGFTVAIAGQMAHMLVDIFNTRPQVQSLWLCAGLIAAMQRLGEAE
jgi:O-antigen ligase